MIREILTIPSAIFLLFLGVLLGIELLAFSWYGFRALPPMAILVGVWIWVASFILEGLRRDLSHKRKKLGPCLKCGYDLRGSKDKCPECGQEFEKRSTLSMNEKGV